MPYKKLLNKFKVSKRIFRYWLLDIIIIFGLLFVLFAMATLFLAKNRFDNDPIKVLIPINSTAKQMSRILYENGVIGNQYSFYWSAKMLGFGNKLKAGTYYFTPSMSNVSILYALKAGRSVEGGIKVVFPEGSSIYRIARTLESKGVTIVNGNLDGLENKGITDELRAQYGFLTNVPIYSLEGYLFPDTYMLPNKIERDRLVELMLNRFEEVVVPVYVTSNMRRYSLHQILTMASIVEKEAENDAERPIIASVFYNRLETGMALRADPTVKYALSSPTKRVTYNDLKVDSPYNTYRVQGLPPGPICNPGLRSILAAIYPARTNYLYFVSNGDGTHSFSRDWAGHVKAVGEYRKIENAK